MASCCCCDTTEKLTLVKLSGRTSYGRVSVANYCKKHLALLTPKKEKKHVEMCCGTPLNRNGHCAVCSET